MSRRSRRKQNGDLCGAVTCCGNALHWQKKQKWEQVWMSWVMPPTWALYSPVRTGDFKFLWAVLCWLTWASRATTFTVAWQHCQLLCDTSVIGCCGPAWKVPMYHLDFKKWIWTDTALVNVMCNGLILNWPLRDQREAETPKCLLQLYKLGPINYWSNICDFVTTRKHILFCLLLCFNQLMWTNNHS